MNADAHLAALQEVFEDVLAESLPPLTLETTADDIEAWDSLSHFELIIAIEKRFGVKITSQETRELGTIANITQLLAAKADVRKVLEFHHIGILVDDIPTALRSYDGLFGTEPPEGPYDIRSQGVRVCFLKMDQGHLEFVEAIGESSILDVVKKRKVKYYHVGYLTADVNLAIAHLAERGYKHVSTFESEAFAGRPCAFLFSPEMHLVELIEKP